MIYFIIDLFWQTSQIFKKTTETTDNTDKIGQFSQY